MLVYVNLIVKKEKGMKKLLLLGGSRYLIPVIEMAHKLGSYVITCDYLPNNIAHKHSDEYADISIIDKEAVLAFAQSAKVDGIMSFACDPGVMTAAYVAEKMGLPFQCSFESASILQDKGLFRKFLQDNGFHCPHAKRYAEGDEPYGDIDFFDWPVIVKPVDSAGSKGVTKVDDPSGLAGAIKIARDHSFNGALIIEDFLTFKGYHSDVDLFTVDGKLKFVTYSDQFFDFEADNRYIPAEIVWPSSMEQEHQDYLTNETQRLMNLLGMRNGIYNVETCVGEDGRPYIMEISPRGGGDKIAEIQELAMGARLIENEVRSALGMPLLEFDTHPADGHWCEMVVHAGSGMSGILKGIRIEKDIMDHFVRATDLSAKIGDAVKPFTGADASLGDVFLRFESREQLEDVMGRYREWLHIDCAQTDAMG